MTFDDGHVSIFSQRSDKLADHSYDSSAESTEAVEARRSRAKKRSRNDDSASQSSMSSPPSSPLTFSPGKKRPHKRIDSDSTETESDFDDPSHPHIGECPPKPSTDSASSEGKFPLKPVSPSSEGQSTPKVMSLDSEGREHSLTAAVSGSESEQPLLLKRGRGRPKKMREPYKLRTAAKLETVQEDKINISSESGEVGGAALTPPPGDIPCPKPIPKPGSLPLSPTKESQKQIPNPAPPETPQTGAHSEGGILKRMLSQEESPTAAANLVKKTPPSHEGSTSPSSKKKSPVSSRTRAQTKFENVRR